MTVFVKRAAPNMALPVFLPMLAAANAPRLKEGEERAAVGWAAWQQNAGADHPIGG